MRSKPIALGGVLAALAVMIMSLGTVIPVATYGAPMLCILLMQAVVKACGKRIAWAWYGAVTLLSLILAPDKEAAMVFAALGYYPIIRPWFAGRRLPWLVKGLYFNGVILALYSLLLYVIGLEMEDTGLVLTLLTLAIGNAVFFLLDLLLDRRFR